MIVVTDPGASVAVIIGLIFQFCLIVCAAWLSIETKLLRERSQDQITVDKDVERNSIAPFLLIDIGDDVSNGLIVSNLVPQLAINAYSFLYDGTNKHYRKDTGVTPYLRIDDSEEDKTTRFASAKLNLDELIQTIQRVLHRLDAEHLKALISKVVQTYPDHQIAGVVAHDVLGNPYLWLRVGKSRNGNVAWKATKWSGQRLRLYLNAETTSVEVTKSNGKPARGTAFNAIDDAR